MPKRKSVLKKKRERTRSVVFILITLLIGAIFVGVWFGARLPEVTITEVRVDGTHFIEAGAVREVVYETLSGSYLWLIPHVNSLLYPNRKVERTLEEVFLPINLVDVSRDGFTTLVVAIEERQEVAVWCASRASTTPCYLMDNTGLLFETGERSTAMVTYSGGVAGKPLGAHFLNHEFPTLQMFLEDMHTATRRSPEAVVVDEYDDMYVYFKEGGELRFVRDYEPQLLLDNIASVFGSGRFQTEERLEYVDFRFGSKVYVKFVGE